MSTGRYNEPSQQKASQSLAEERDPYLEGQHASHQNIDAKDNRSIPNKAAAEKMGLSFEQVSGKRDPEAELSKQNPVKPAIHHGNEPSKGAKIDEELQKEDEERLRQKGVK